MSMSTYIRGIRPPDAKWLQMKTIWDGCKAVGIDPPDVVGSFFNWEEPHPEGVEVEIQVPKAQGKHETEDVWRIDLTDLPDDLRYIEFANSY